jgi:hypothetical protein
MDQPQHLSRRDHRLTTGGLLEEGIECAGIDHSCDDSFTGTARKR